MFILEGMLKHALGETLESRSTVANHDVHAEMIEGEYNYDTQFVIKGQGLDVPAILDHISTMGDSVLVVGDETAVKVHVHCDHPRQGRRIWLRPAANWTPLSSRTCSFSIREFMKQPSVPELASPVLSATQALSDTGIVAVISGAGLEKVFESLGVDAVVPGGPDHEPIDPGFAPGDRVEPARQRSFYCPTTAISFWRRQQAQALSSKEVAVVPTKTIPQGISALLAFNYQAELDDNVGQMSQASGMVDTIEITRAVRTTTINGLSISEGEYIGLIDGDLVTAGVDLDELLRDLLERVDAADCEIVTIYYGQDTLRQ